MRYTEYHADKAVIKDKALLPDAMEKLAKVEDKELTPCSMCLNGRIDEDLTDDNDMSSFSIGKSQDGFRMMYTSGDGKPPRIEAQQWDKRVGWYNVGIYYPKFCPNCGREITEYGR